MSAQEEFEKLAKQKYPELNFKKYEDKLVASRFGQKVGDYCSSFERDLWKGFELAKQPNEAENG